MISHSASFTNFNGLNTTLLPKLKRFSLITNQTDSIPCCHLNKYNCFCTDDEALEGDWDMYMDGARSSRCISNAAARPSHPIGHDDSPLAMMIVQNTHPMLKPDLNLHYPPGYLPHCSAALPIRVAIYLYPHLAD